MPRLSSASDSYLVDLPRIVVERLAAHAAECLPEECCGILIGRKTAPRHSRVRYALEAVNVRRTRRDREYAIAPLAVLDAERAARDQGLEVVGYYHSHPEGSPAPSALDRRNAWPETSYVILGMENGGMQGLKSWRLPSGAAAFVEEQVRCEGRPV